MIIYNGERTGIDTYKDIHVEERYDIMNKEYSLDEILKLIDDNALYLTNNPNSKKLVWIKEYIWTPADRRATTFHQEYFVNPEYNGKEYAISKYFTETKLIKEELDKIFDYIYNKGISNPKYREYLYLIIKEPNYELFDEEQLKKLEKTIDIHRLPRLFRSKFLNVLVNKYDKNDWIKEAKFYLDGIEQINKFIVRESVLNSFDLKELKDKGVSFTKDDLKSIFNKWYSNGNGELFSKIVNLSDLSDDKNTYGSVVSDWSIKYDSKIVYDPYQIYVSEKTKSTTFPLSIYLDDDNMCKVLKNLYQEYSNKEKCFLVDYYKDVCSIFSNNVDYQFSIIEQIVDNIKNSSKKEDAKKCLNDLCIYIENLKKYNDVKTINKIKEKLKELDFEKLVNPQFDLNIATNINDFFFTDTIIRMIKKRMDNIDNLAFHIPRDYFVGQMENVKMESVDSEYKNTIIHFLQHSCSKITIDKLFNYFTENDIKNFSEYIYIIIRTPEIVRYLSDEQILTIYNNFDVHYEEFNSNSKTYCSTGEFNKRLVEILFKDNNSNRDLLIKEFKLYVNTINPEYVENPDDEYKSIFEHVNIYEFIKKNNIILKPEEIETIINSFNFEADINASRDNLLRNLYKFVEGIAMVDTTPNLPNILYNWMNKLDDDNFMDVLFYFNYEQYFSFLKYMDNSMKLDILKSTYLRKYKLLNKYPHLEEDVYRNYNTIKDLYPNFEELQSQLNSLLQYTLINEKSTKQERSESEIISDFIYKMENKALKKIKKPNKINLTYYSNLPLDDDLPF